MNSPLERRSFTEIFNNENNAPKKKADITELIYTNLGTFQSFFPKNSKNMRKFSSRKNSKTFHIFWEKIWNLPPLILALHVSWYSGGALLWIDFLSLYQCLGQI